MAPEHADGTDNEDDEELFNANDDDDFNDNNIDNHTVNNPPGHGTCTMPTYRMAWECLCQTGWYGPGCDIELEQQCDDKIDNDRGQSVISTLFLISLINRLFVGKSHTHFFQTDLHIIVNLVVFFSRLLRKSLIALF